jgi:hypothetical protein
MRAVKGYVYKVKCDQVRPVDDFDYSRSHFPSSACRRSEYDSLDTDTDYWRECLPVFYRERARNVERERSVNIHLDNRVDNLGQLVLPL